MRSVLMILAAVQVIWPAGLALIYGSADGMTGWELAALLAAQVVGTVGLVILARMGQPISPQTAAGAVGLLVVALAADLLLTITNVLGVTSGSWCLLLMLGLIPVIGLLYTYWNLRRTLTATFIQYVAPVSVLPEGHPPLD